MRSATLFAALAAAVVLSWGISPTAEARTGSVVLDASGDTEWVAESGTYVRVRTKDARKRVRMALWTAGLEGDRASVYDREGMPPFRHYENFAGERTEVWTYPRSERRYIFSGDTLVRSMRYASVQFATKRR